MAKNRGVMGMIIGDMFPEMEGSGTKRIMGMPLGGLFPEDLGAEEEHNCGFKKGDLLRDANGVEWIVKRVRTVMSVDVCDVEFSSAPEDYTGDIPREGVVTFPAKGLEKVE